MENFTPMACIQLNPTKNLLTNMPCDRKHAVGLWGRPWRSANVAKDAVILWSFFDKLYMEVHDVLLTNI